MKRRSLNGILGISSEILFSLLFLSIGVLIAWICWVISQ